MTVPARAVGERGSVVRGSIGVVAHPETTDVDALVRAVAAAAGRPHDAISVARTTPAEAGSGLAEGLVRQGCELVIAAGGDGTVRAVASALVGSDVALGIVPTGTGNLLARNLSLPDDVAQAVDVAVHGSTCTIDCGRADGQAFFVMAGVGVDAAMVRDASPRLKKHLGWPAYVLSGAKHLLRPPTAVAVRLDEGPWQRRRVATVLVGNVGRLQAGLALFPDADPTDGLLEAAVLTPRSLRQWAHVALHLSGASGGPIAELERHRVRRLELRSARALPFELDGDDAGRTRSLVVQVEPSALQVRVRP